MPTTYTNLEVEIHDRIGVIQLKKPTHLNNWNESLLTELITAFRVLHNHPRTVCTVLTSEGEWFSGTKNNKAKAEKYHIEPSSGEIKLLYMHKFTRELLRLMFHHHKSLFLALNGPAIASEAGWLDCVVDITVTAAAAYLQAPYRSLAPVAESGADRMLVQRIWAGRMNDGPASGQRSSVEKLECCDQGLDVKDLGRRVRQLVEEGLGGSGEKRGTGPHKKPMEGTLASFDPSDGALGKVRWKSFQHGAGEGYTPRGRKSLL